MFRQHRLALSCLQIFFNNRFKVVDVVKRDALNLADFRVNVARDGNVDEKNSASLPPRHQLLRLPRLNDVMRRARGCDDYVDVRRAGEGVFPRDSFTADSRRHFLCALQVMIRHVNFRDAVSKQMLSRELSHLARSED